MTGELGTNEVEIGPRLFGYKGYELRLTPLRFPGWPIRWSATACLLVLIASLFMPWTVLQYGYAGVFEDKEDETWNAFEHGNLGLLVLFTALLGLLVLHTQTFFRGKLCDLVWVQKRCSFFFKSQEKLDDYHKRMNIADPSMSKTFNLNYLLSWLYIIPLFMIIMATDIVASDTNIDYDTLDIEYGGDGIKVARTSMWTYFLLFATISLFWITYRRSKIDKTDLSEEERAKDI